MKHKLLIYIAGALILMYHFQSCKKDKYWPDAVVTTITAASDLQPGDGPAIELDPNSNSVVVFSWKAARTGDNTLVFYKVLFDKAGGDFSKPVDSLETGHSSSDTSIALSHKQLNILAEKAGIAALAKGQLTWKVMASNGVVDKLSEETGKFTVQRPAGFAQPPTLLFLYGDATEAGPTKANALNFKKLSDGVFELYTSLKAGSFMLADSTKSFSVAAGSVSEGAQSESPVTDKRVYRIRIDFNSSKVGFTQIESMGLWFAGDNKVIKQLDYTGDGTWKIEHTDIQFSPQSWGKDERYKFRSEEKNSDGDEQFVFWSSKNKDNQKPTSSTASSYFDLAGNDSSQWDFTYKFQQESKDADIILRFQSGGNYTHSVIYH